MKGNLNKKAYFCSFQKSLFNLGKNRFATNVKLTRSHLMTSNPVLALCSTASHTFSLLSPTFLCYVLWSRDHCCGAVRCLGSRRPGCSGIPAYCWAAADNTHPLSTPFLSYPISFSSLLYLLWSKALCFTLCIGSIMGSCNKLLSLILTY